MSDEATGVANNDEAVEGTIVEDSPIASGEQPIDSEESKSSERIKVDALAFADKMFPLVSDMMFDPLCAVVGSTYRASSDKRKVPCAIMVFLDHGNETAKIVERHPLKVVLYGIAKVFPGITKLGDSERIETVITVLFTLQAAVMLGASVYAGIPKEQPMAVETPNTVETTVNASEQTAKPSKRQRKAKVAQ